MTFRRALVLGSAGAALVLSACSSGGFDIPVTIRPTIEAEAATAPIDTNDTGDLIVDVVELARPAVVNVTTDVPSSSDPFGGGPGSGSSVGTGFIIRGDGIVVTNYHVIQDAVKITVITPAPTQERYEARVIGSDQERDLAVLKIEADETLPTVTMGSSADLKLGQRVVALGYALALPGGPTVTTGIVSALDRTVQASNPSEEDGTTTYRDVLQTDAAINPGNSGGPLLDLAGRVVGINSAGSADAENIGFAIAIDAAKPIIDDAVDNPEAARAYLGVTTQTVDRGVALQFDLPVNRGALILDTVSGGPADRAGLATGDVIIGIGNDEVRSSEELGELLREFRPGQTVAVALETADDGRRLVPVKLGTRPLN